MVRVFYAAHNLAGYHEYDVVLLDDAIPEEEGLVQSGFFVQLVTPERFNGDVQDPNRAG